MADEPDPKDDPKRTPLKAMRDAWLALTGALATAETEVQKRFYETLGVSPDANLGAELMAKVKKNREEFARRSTKRSRRSKSASKSCSKKSSSAAARSSHATFSGGSR